MKVKCDKCGHEWKMPPFKNHLPSGIILCPNCNGLVFNKNILRKIKDTLKESPVAERIREIWLKNHTILKTLFRGDALFGAVDGNSELYTCEICGYQSLLGAIEEHHIVPISVALISDEFVSKTIRVCPTCHRELHNFNILQEAKTKDDYFRALELFKSEKNALKLLLKEECNCEICGYPLLPGVMEEHHIVSKCITKEKSKPDSKTIRICPTCHKEIHCFYVMQECETEDDYFRALELFKEKKRRKEL